jgi:hypothetical protein
MMPYDVLQGDEGDKAVVPPGFRLISICPVLGSIMEDILPFCPSFTLMLMGRFKAIFKNLKINFYLKSV